MLDIFISDERPPEDPLWLVRRPDWREELLRPCLQEFTSPGDIVLDPFARHPALLRAACDTGRRALLTNFDPLPLLRLTLTHSPPEPSALDRVVSRLADTPRHGQPLSRALDDLYLVTCPDCTQPLPAEFLVWEGSTPTEKGYDCRHCSQRGVAAIAPQDLDIQAAVEAQGASYWRMHQRLATADDGERLGSRVTRLLNLYTARNRYALTELILQAEILFLGDETALDIIRGLCLAALQRCHSLSRSVDAAVDLPRSLQRPRHFVERNVWRTFEAAYRQLRSLARTPAVTWSADLAAFMRPPSAREPMGAFSRQLNTRQLGEALKDYPPLPLICTDPPRPASIDHALAFLWSGWLFGRKATLPLRSLALRTRRDWEWYAGAMTGVLRVLNGLLADGGRLLLAFAGEEDELLPSLLLAAARTELDLEQTIQRNQGDTGADGPTTTHRLLFRRRHRPVHPLPRLAEEEDQSLQQRSLELRQEGVAAAQTALEVLGEPATSYWLAPPIYRRWSQGDLLRDLPSRQASFNPLGWLVQQLAAVLPTEGDVPFPLLRLQSPVMAEEEAAAQTCWWLSSSESPVPPLSERVEEAAAHLLRGTLAWPEDALHDELCRQFGGLLTPDRPFLDACIASYGQELSPGYWQLRAEDWPQARSQARHQTVLLLVELGRWMNLGVWLAPEERAQLSANSMPSGRERDQPPDGPWQWAPCKVIWHDAGAPQHGFALSDTAALSPWLAPVPPALADFSRYVIVPGGRSVLLAFKLRRCPEYYHRLEAHKWTIVKQRHLRRLADMEDLDTAGWRARIGIDPVLELTEEQLTLF
jgi:hypothetical protein